METKLSKDQNVATDNSNKNSNNDNNVDVDSTKMRLKRSIGLLGGAGLIVGCIIGSGIFISPTGVLERTGSVGAYLLAWAMCGIVAMLGALCFAELGATIPEAGAEYNYILASFGPIPAFLFVWSSVFIIKPACVTIVAISSAYYITEAFFPSCIVPQALIKIVSAIVILSVTLLNMVSVKWSLRINSTFAWSKFVCIAIIAIIGFVNLRHQESRDYFKDPFKDTQLSIKSVGYGLYYVLWAYDGFNTLNYAAEEMKNPGKTLPRALILGMSIVMISFLIINVCYVAAIGPKGILESDTVGLTVGYKFLGNFSFIIPILVSCCTLGTEIATVYGNARLLFVAGRNGHLPMILSSIHRKARTPVASLVFTSTISTIMLIPPGSEIDNMIGLFSFATWTFFLLCFMSLLYLRFKKPELERSFKIPIVIPMIMCVVALVLIILPIYENVIGFGIATGCILLGLPIYAVFIAYRDKLPQKPFKWIDNASNYIMDVYDLALPEREEDMG